MNDSATRPLCVDLDGTLVATDTLFEGLLDLVRDRPLSALAVPLWWLRGRSVLKAEVAARAPLDPARLPYRDEVLAYLRAAHESGRHCVLATAADERTADAVARHLGVFDRVLASDGTQNLKGAAKRAALDEHFGEGGYEYLGDAHADTTVWAGAAHASSVGLSDAARARLASKAPGGVHFDAPRETASSWVRALRLHQWVKNLLVFLPLLASHRFLEPVLVLQGVWAFLAFGLLASAVYVMNDLLDLAADRAHPVNATRPFASGEIPLVRGFVVGPLLVAAALMLAALVLPQLLGLLVLYLVANVAYTFALKRVAIADVMLLAMLYALRVLAGGVATGIVLSPWLMAFSLFFFMNLAFLKRYADLRILERAGQTKVAGRDYAVSDAPLLLALGPASGYVAAVVLALYVQADPLEALYAEPRALFALIPLLVYWISRFWVRAHRGLVRADPIVSTVTDPVSYVVLALAIAVFGWAALGTLTL